MVSQHNYIKLAIILELTSLHFLLAFLIIPESVTTEYSQAIVGHTI